MEHVLLPINGNKEPKEVISDVYDLLSYLKRIKEIKNDESVSDLEFLDLYKKIFWNQNPRMFIPLIVNEQFAGELNQAWKVIEIRTKMVDKKDYTPYTRSWKDSTTFYEYYKLSCSFAVKKDFNFEDKEYSYEELEELIHCGKIIQYSYPQRYEEITSKEYEDGVKNIGATKLLSGALTLTEMTNLFPFYISLLKKSLKDEKIDELIRQAEILAIEKLSKLKSTLSKKRVKMEKSLEELNSTIDSIDVLLSETIHCNQSDVKIPGIYPGNYCDYRRDLTDEFILFSLIDRTSGRYDTPFEQMSESDFALDYLIYQTKKFGTNIPNPQVGKRVVLTDEYHSWFSYIFAFLDGINNSVIEDGICVGNIDPENYGYIPWEAPEETGKSRKIKK